MPLQTATIDKPNEESCCASLAESVGQREAGSR
jgi:hypothetical protein